MTDPELKRVRDRLSTVELSLTELRQETAWFEMISACNRATVRRFQTLVGAMKLSLPPMRN